MEISTHNRIEFKLNIEKNSYSFVVPHGVQIKEATEACNGFLLGLMELEKEKDKEVKKNKKVKKEKKEK